mgnify:CR=1 FL=1
MPSPCGGTNKPAGGPYGSGGSTASSYSFLKRAISSAAGIKGSPLHTPYTASKHGVVGMSKALANELAAVNIRVNTVHPTGVPTGMQPATLHTLLHDKRADLGPIFQNALPIVMAEAVDISNAVLFLISDEARYVTGLEFKVDAGVTIR